MEQHRRHARRQLLSWWGNVDAPDEEGAWRVVGQGALRGLAPGGEACDGGGAVRLPQPPRTRQQPQRAPKPIPAR